MRRSRWVVSGTVLGVLVCGTSAVPATQAGAGHEELAAPSNSRPESIAKTHITQAPAPNLPQSRTAAPAVPARQVPDAPRRVETNSVQLVVGDM